MAAGEFKFGGIIKVPLFVAPYQLPSKLIGDFLTNPVFQGLSPVPIIQSIFTSSLIGSPFVDYWNAVVPSPFDFGWTYYNPTDASSAPTNFGITLTYDGTAINHFLLFPGDGISTPKILSTGNYLTGSPAIMGGRNGDKLTLQPMGIRQQFTNGFTDFDFADPYDFNAQTQGCVTSPLGTTFVYDAADTAASSIMDQTGVAWNLTIYSANIGFIGEPYNASNIGLYYPPSTFVPGGRFLPWSLLQKANGFPPRGANTPPPGPIPLNDPVQILFEAPYDLFIDGFQQINTVYCSFSYLIGVSSQTAFPNNAFTMVLVDLTPDHETFYFVQFFGQTASAVQALTDVTHGVPSVAYDERIGVFYLLPSNPSQAGLIFHSEALAVPGFIVNVDTPTPFVLPCFNPCQPFILPKR